MNLTLFKPALILTGVLTMIAFSACRNTVHGVVHDTERNTKKVGRGVANVGNKIGEGVETTGEAIQRSTR